MKKIVVLFSCFVSIFSSKAILPANDAWIEGSSVGAPPQEHMGRLPKPFHPAGTPLRAPGTGHVYPAGRYVQCFCKKCDNPYLLYACYCGRALYCLPLAASMCACAVGFYTACCPFLIISSQSGDPRIIGWDCFDCCASFLCFENVIWPRDFCCLGIDRVDDERCCCFCDCCDQPGCYSWGPSPEKTPLSASAAAAGGAGGE